MIGRTLKGLLVVLGAVMTSVLWHGIALAQEHGGGGGDASMIALAAGLAIGGAAIGAGLGQGRAVAAAMESIGRNPNAADRIQTPMILGLAFIEALAIYALVIAFLLQNKIG
ncbi:MAG TPA: ATP synthase F0 subunit C [Candidatus Binatia bacterium]|nr:ATP synthase F0 subunit C [Candidatus Binatia bacterium]